jgi:GNAT superfamily N-acetyltransferase
MTQPRTPKPDDWLLRSVGSLLRLLGRIGIRINPFLVVREGNAVADATLPDVASDADGLQFAVAGPEQIDALLRLQRSHTHASISDWFDAGKLCFLASAGDQVVALMWCDLTAFNYPPHFRALAADEAYLFAALADPAFRGRSVAPALRRFCYQELRRRGIERFYSYTDWLNVPARRFKAKLGARDEALRVGVDLWGRWRGTFTLRRYD